jgi:hypothetical protein
MVKILANHLKDTDDELKSRIEYRFGKMDKNPTYVFFGTQIIKMGDLLARFKAATSLAKDTGSAAAKNKQKEELCTFVSLFNREIEVEANRLPQEEAETYAIGTGADIQKSRTGMAAAKLAFLAIPDNFDAVDVKKRAGVYELTWGRCIGARIYVLEEVDEAGKLLNTTYHTKTSVTVTGSASRVLKFFRLKATGADGLESGYTDTIGVWIS